MSDSPSNRTPGELHSMSAAGIEIELPPDVSATTDAVVDGVGVTFEGPGIRLIVDRSPFADPLTAYEDRPQFGRRSEEVAGRRVDVVSFSAQDGTHVLAMRMPDTLTAVAHVAPDGDRELALRMLRSIRPTQEEP